MPLKDRRSTGLALCALSLILAACRPAPEKPAAPAPAPAPAPVAAAPPIPAPSPPLGRAELIAAVEAAASAYAAGQPAPEEAGALADRRFALRLPFGCAAAVAGAPARYTYDAKEKTLRLSARPETWTDTPWVRALVGSPETEAVEGFWLRRPWLRTETCPAVTAAEGAAPSPETLGLAQVFEKGGSRLLRRGARGYEATSKRDEALTAGGFRLVLEGRIAQPEAGGPVRCRSDGPDQRPVCLVMVELDRVAFEDAGGETLSEWRS